MPPADPLRQAQARRALICSIVGFAVACAYLSVRSHFFNFDGVACAIAVDLGDLRHLAHGNHLGYGVAGLAFFKLLGTVGYKGTSLWALQILDSLLGAAGAGLFCALLLEAGVSSAVAVLASAGLAFSFAWWFWSMEAQVYMLGCLFLVLAAREALSPAPRPGRVGLWQALAILGHVGHLMFLPAAVYLLAAGRERRERKAVLARYALAMCGSVLAAYLLAAVLFIRPASWDQARVWLLGSAALRMDKSFVWFGGWSLENLRAWLGMSLRVFSEPVEAPAHLRSLAWTLSGLAAAACAAGAVLRRDRPARAALLWLAGFAALYTSWQPHTMVYRVSDLPAAWLLIALAASPARGKGAAWRTALLAAYVGAAGFFNWKLLVEPWTRPERNPVYEDALWQGKVVPENGWVAVLGLDQVYVPYFGLRKPLNIRYYEGNLPALEERLARLEKAREPVFVSSEALKLGDWRAFFEAYGLTEAGRSPHGLVLYRAARKTGPKRRKGA